MCPGYIFPTMKEPITEVEFVTSALKQYYKMAEQAHISGAFDVEFIVSSNRVLHIRVYSYSPYKDRYTITDDFGVNLDHAESLRWNLGKLEEFATNIIARAANNHRPGRRKESGAFL